MSIQTFSIGNLVTGIGFSGIAEIQSKNDAGQLECVTEGGDSYFCWPDSLTLYSDHKQAARQKVPAETVTVSECCGAMPTELCNDDSGFCPECRDHAEFVDVCIECSEENCICPDPTWVCKYCDAVSHDDKISQADGICFRRPSGTVGPHTFRRTSDQYFDRNVKTDEQGIIQI